MDGHNGTFVFSAEVMNDSLGHTPNVEVYSQGDISGVSEVSGSENVENVESMENSQEDLVIDSPLSISHYVEQRGSIRVSRNNIPKHVIPKKKSPVTVKRESKLNKLKSNSFGGLDSCSWGLPLGDQIPPLGQQFISTSRVHLSEQQLQQSNQHQFQRHYSQQQVQVQHIQSAQPYQQYEDGLQNLRKYQHAMIGLEDQTNWHHSNQRMTVMANMTPTRSVNCNQSMMVPMVQSQQSHGPVIKENNVVKRMVDEIHMPLSANQPETVLDTEKFSVEDLLMSGCKSITMPMTTIISTTSMTMMSTHQFHGDSVTTTTSALRTVTTTMLQDETRDVAFDWK